MESALIVSCTDKGTTFFTDLLNKAGLIQIAALQSCGEARRLLLEREFDLIIINSPLRDETGESFARYIASKGLSQAILVVKSELFEAISAVCEDDGVLVVAKPINKAILWSAFTLARSAMKQMKRVQNENERLKQKAEDIRIVARAKCTLISHMNMSEQEAHRFIEKQAMDMRSTRRIVAEGILKTYEN